MGKQKKKPLKIDAVRQASLSWSYSFTSAPRVHDDNDFALLSQLQPVNPNYALEPVEPASKKSKVGGFFLSVNLIFGTNNARPYLIGSFFVDIHEDFLMLPSGKGRLRFDPTDPQRTLVLQTSCSSVACSVSWIDKFSSMDDRTYDSSDLLIDLAKSGRSIQCCLSSTLEKRCIVHVFLNESEIITYQEILDDKFPSKSTLAVSYLIRYFHGFKLFHDVQLPDECASENSSDWVHLFAEVERKLKATYTPHNRLSSSSDLSGLSTKLRPYQHDAVQWMFDRENVVCNGERLFNYVFPLIFSILTLNDGSACFFNRLSGKFIPEIPAEMTIPSGGILADEMGLGKTLEVLTLIMINPRHIDTLEKQPQRIDLSSKFGSSSGERFSCLCGDMYKGNDLITCNDCNSIQHISCIGWEEDFSIEAIYRCPYCILNYPPVVSRATLVVSPNTICGQWLDEIVFHSKNLQKSKPLKVFTYQGVRQSGVYVQPKFLADNDVVIVSYETLRSELTNANLQYEDRNTCLRTQKRFMAIPSPLPAIDWWRLCLDEAQMVESPNQAAKMVQRLQSTHRWCITGTPISRSIDDLFGLLGFLKFPLFSGHLYWSQLVSKPYYRGNRQPLINLLSTIFWRTTKHSVLDQIGVPPMSESVIFLTFTPVEEHIYRYQYNTRTLSSVYSDLCRYDRSTLLRQIDRRTVDRFLDPMVPLRRACSDLGKRSHLHPHSRQHQQFSGMKLAQTMTMSQVLKDLLHRAATTCTDYNRQYVMCINGLAGLHFLSGDLKKAAELYRLVLWTSRDNAKICETDKLQLIHATHNLNDVIMTAHSLKDCSVGSAPGDDSLSQQEANLVNAYVGKLEARVEECRRSVKKYQAEVDKIDSEFYTDWWAEVSERLLGNLSDADFIDFILRLQNNLRDTSSGAQNLASNVSSSRSFMMAVSKKLDSIAKYRQAWRDAMFRNLMKIAPGDLSEQLSSCSCTLMATKYPRDDTTPTSAKPVSGNCGFCQAEKVCVDYEKVLFNARVNVLADGNDSEVWAWSESETERTLKFLLGFAKRNQRRFEEEGGTDVTELFEAGDKHLERFQRLKSEFRHMRQLWISFKDRVGAEIELNMAADRFQLWDDNNKEERPNKSFVTRNEIPLLLQSNERDADMAKSNFEKACGQLRYLRSLEKTVENNQTTKNDDKCPICMSELGISWSVLPCAHCICLECVTTLRSMVLANKRLPCPVCRSTLAPQELAYVSLRPVDEIFPEDSIEMNGNYSTKFMAVIKIIKVVLKRDSSAKFLVFSNWLDVLSSLSLVMIENGISALLLQKGGSGRKKSSAAVAKLGGPVKDKFTSTLQRFRISGDESETVSTLLLPYSSGSNGLNLTEANHVILMDPCLTQSMDAQAIARVYRMGQKRPTTIHRLFVRSTIEERIYSVLLKRKQLSVHHEFDEMETGVYEEDVTDGTQDAVVGDLIDLYRSELDDASKIVQV